MMTSPLSSSSDASAPLSQDMALVNAMITGSSRAWREFHRLYDRLIYRCITKVTARFSMIVSQDDIAEIYATLLVQLLSNEKHKLRTFAPERGNAFGSWIGLLAINCAYDYLRSRRREPAGASIDEIEELWSDAPSPHDLMELKEKARLLEDILRDFSDKDREFVALYFGEGLDAEQIAARMQISVKTVYSKKHKIQCRIDRLVGDRLGLAA